MASMLSAASVIVRATSRLNPETATGCGSATNELMRHMLFVLLLTQMLTVDPGLYLILIFCCMP